MTNKTEESGGPAALRGESVDTVSREIAVPIYKLELWRDRALTGIDAGLKERENDLLEKSLDEGKRRIGELVMEVEILQKEGGLSALWSAGGHRNVPPAL